MIVTGGEVIRFLEAMIGRPFVPPYAAIGREVNGDIVAGACFNVYTVADIEVSVAALKGGITRSFIRACSDYAFRQIECERVTITTENEEVASFARRIGARDEGLKRHAFGRDRHGLMLGILKEEFRL